MIAADEVCKRCGLVDRYANRSCRTCHHASAKRYKAKNPPTPTKRITEKKWRDDHINHVLVMNAKQRATRLGLPFDLTPAEIHVPDVCPILGIPLVRGSGDPHGQSPSLDRIIPEKGYVHGNVQVISYKANSMKRDASVEELLRFANYVLATFSNRETA